MQLSAVIADVDFRSLAGGVTVIGLALDEVVDLGHGSGKDRVGFHAGKIFQTRFTADFWNFQVFLREYGRGEKYEQTGAGQAQPAIKIFHQSHFLETRFRSLTTPGAPKFNAGGSGR